MVRSFRYWFKWQRNVSAGGCRCFGVVVLLFYALAANAESPAPENIAAILEQANALYADKRFDDARQAFERALALDKGSLPAWRGLGWSHWALGQKPRAYQIWGDLLKAFPDDLPTLTALGKASEQDRRWQDAATYYAQILRLQAHNPAAHLGRARVFIAQQQFQAAEQAAQAALQATPNDKSAQSLLADALIGQGHYQQAVALLRPLARTEPVPANLLRLGKALAELGHYEQAADIYKASLAQHPDDGTIAAWRGLGASLRKAGQNQRAYALWQGLLRTAPSDLPTLLAIGLASEQDKLWQQGLEYYAQALQKSPGNHAAHLGRARIFSAKKDYKAAELELKSILERAPSDLEARSAMVENLNAQGRSVDAISMLEPIVELNPTSKKFSRLGTLLADAGRSEEAANYFRKSLQLDPNDSSAVLGLAHTYWERHEYGASITLLQSYLARHPDNDTVRTRLAEHASAADNWELAEREWQFLAAKHPEELKWKLKLAHLLHRAGRHEDAVKIATGILAKEPDNENALALLADDATFAGHIDAAISWTNRLVTVAPKLDRLIRLGRLHMQLGETLDKEGKHEAAVIQYAAATQAYRRAEALDPIKSMAAVDIIQAQLLMGQQAEATTRAQQLYAEHPISADAIKQLAAAYREQGDYAAASEMLANNSPFYPNSSALKQNLAELAYHAGDKEEAFEMLDEILEAENHPTVPVLLYHGITLSDRQDTVSSQKFREQLLALKQAGYQSITTPQLLGFLEGDAALPAKPILITFDDARADSFKYADPVLKETGFQATMFVPVGDVATHQPYAAVWPTIAKMFANGRWDMQCHGANAQHYVPVDAEGHQGHFLANRMWLADTARLETNEEYAARIEQDMLTCKETVAREVPGVHISAFAFPYGDQGHRSLSNAPDAFDINQSIVEKQFSLAFNVDNTYLVTAGASKFALPRFEVPRTFSGKELVQQLKAIDPELSTYNKLAHLDVESGRYAQALEIMDKLANEGVVDNADLLTTAGKVLIWTGDHAGARDRLEQAMALRPDDPDIQRQIAVLDRRLRPSLQMGGLYFEDNAQRSYYSFGPSAQYGVSDRLAVSAYYKHLEFDQELDDASFGLVDTQQQYQASGNQFGAQINYELAARSALSLSAGFADFAGDATPLPAKSGSTFPLGAAKLTAGVADWLDLSVAADHTYVNTAAAILNGIAFTRVEGKAKAKLLDSLSLSVSNAYFNYTDDNQRNRTEVELTHKVWDDPGVSVGLQFIHDNMQHDNLLFWAPDEYQAFTVPISLKKKWWGDALVTEISLEPGMGKEAGSDFKFQFNGAGNLTWNVQDDLGLSFSLNRYQAATYSNISGFASMFLRF